jgi:hypothetical protein
MLVCFLLRFLLESWWKPNAVTAQNVTPLKKDKMKAVHPSGHSGTAEVLNPPTKIRALSSRLSAKEVGYLI